MSRCAKLSVFSCRGNFTQQHFIHIALYVLKSMSAFGGIFFNFLKNIFYNVDGRNQQTCFGHNEHCIGHVFGKKSFTGPFCRGRSIIAKCFKKWKYFHLHMQQHFVCRLVFKNTPTQFIFIYFFIAAGHFKCSIKP